MIEDSICRVENESDDGREASKRKRKRKQVESAKSKQINGKQKAKKNRASTHQRVSCGLVLKENDRHETTTQSKGKERIEEGNTEQSAAHTYKRVHLK